MNDMPGFLVTVLIGTRNRPEPLARCLRSVLNQDYDNLELIVLDDCSEPSDSLKEVIGVFEPSNVRFLRSEIPLGIAAGRNHLMVQSTGEFVIVLDDDAIFPNRSDISTIVKSFNENPDVGIIAIKVVEPESEHPKYLVPFSKSALRNDPGLVDQQSYVSYFVGTCHAFRRSTINLLPGYDGDLVYGLEESFYSYRALQNNIRILYVPDAMIHHLPESSVVPNKTAGDIEIYYGIRNRIWFAYQFLPIRYLLIYWTVWIVLLGARSIKSRHPANFLRGLARGIYSCRQRRRTPLHGTEITYLKKHHGRLYY